MCKQREQLTVPMILILSVVPDTVNKNGLDVNGLDTIDNFTLFQIKLDTVVIKVAGVAVKGLELLPVGSFNIFPIASYNAVMTMVCVKLLFLST